MKIDPYYQRQKQSHGSADLALKQIVHKFAGWVTSGLDFKITIFFSVIYLENGRRRSYTYSGS